MNVTSVPRSEIRQFSPFSAAFSQSQVPFSDFLQRPFDSIETLTAQAKLKQSHYPAENRKVLVETLRDQLAGMLSGKQSSNLDLLEKDTTFTITTGHQLTLFGGPMFFLYKVLQAVKLAEEFNARQNEYQAVPVFWMASEDHDVEEIRSTNLFNQTLQWDTKQTGPVGRFHLDDYATVLTALRELFVNKPNNELTTLLDKLSLSGYNVFFQQFVSELFAEYGVLVIQPDTPALKHLFAPVLKRELTEQLSFPAVQEMNKKLEAAGLSPQAQARGCNLFLLSQNGRHRIDPSANGCTINGKAYATEELLDLVDAHPENFSPNVILRPVYQETVLPNLVYIGGGGEMAYWIQLKGVFEAYDVDFPLIQQRVSLHIIDGGTAKRIGKSGWKMTDFFEPKEGLRKRYLQESGGEELNMEQVRGHFSDLRLAMIQKAKSIDVSLESYAEAETVRLEKQLESYESRLLKQVKQQHDQSLKSIDAVCDRFIPHGELQERYFHWLNFAASGDYSGLFKQVYEAMDPFNGELILLELDH